MLKAINASLLITTPKGLSHAIGSAFPSISTIQLVAKGLAQSKDADSGLQDHVVKHQGSKVNCQGDHTRVERWGDVVAYVKAWDEAK